MTEYEKLAVVVKGLEFRLEAERVGKDAAIAQLKKELDEVRKSSSISKAYRVLFIIGIVSMAIMSAEIVIRQIGRLLIFILNQRGV